MNLFIFYAFRILSKDLLVSVPSMDVRTAGTGRRSIAFVAKMTGALRVGPESPALPGPACSNQGGIKDAFAVLGHLPPALLGGSFRPDISAAHQSIEENIVKPMGLDSVVEAAEGIIRITLE